jgi:hypothetical protein
LCESLDARKTAVDYRAVRKRRPAFLPSLRNKMSLYIVVTGNPADGFEHIGPFKQEHYASEWADTWLPDLDWWVVPLIHEEDKQNGK